jgi:hypothetical protein
MRKLLIFVKFSHFHLLRNFQKSQRGVVQGICYPMMHTIYSVRCRSGHIMRAFFDCKHPKSVISYALSDTSWTKYLENNQSVCPKRHLMNKLQRELPISMPPATPYGQIPTNTLIIQILRRMNLPKDWFEATFLLIFSKTLGKTGYEHR